jgi:hypothetical protein
MMGYRNPLLSLPAGQALLQLPAADRRRIEAVMRELRHQANAEAERAWKRRKGPMAAYWRAVATYARHLAHALSHRPDRAPRRIDDNVAHNAVLSADAAPNST